MRVTEESFQGNVSVSKARCRRRIKTTLLLRRRGRLIREMKKILRISFTIIVTNLVIRGLIV